MIREIVFIDEDKCDGCGLCVPACEEGAIRIISGKARLISDRLCDGLGACLGHCPRGAIRIEKREAAEFDEHAVHAHVQARHGSVVDPADPAVSQPGGCPSQQFARLGQPAPRPSCPASGMADATESFSPPNPEHRSELTQWPVQLKLLPPRAPVFQDADLLLAADCVPFALADFHSRLLRGCAVAIACPKLDDTSTYLPKLTEILTANRVKSITVVHMEVPCCTGILRLAVQARAASGTDVPIEDVVVSVRGDVLRRRMMAADAV